MSIAMSLERTTRNMEVFWLRNNGDLDRTFSELLDALKADIERVRGLEEMAALDTVAVDLEGTLPPLALRRAARAAS